MYQGEDTKKKSRQEPIKLHGDILLIGSGTLSSIVVNGTWFYVNKKKETEPESRPLLSGIILSSMNSLNLNHLPSKSTVEVNGNLYFHPDACLHQEDWGSYLAIETVVVSELPEVHHTCRE